MVSGTNDRFLRKDVAIRLAYEKAEPNLIWSEFVTMVPEQTNAFMYRYDSTGRSSDTKKQKPAPFTLGGTFPEVDRTRKVIASDLTATNGFSMRLPREVIRSVAQQNEIADAFSYAGYWIAEWINTSVITAMISGSTTPTWTPTAVWSSSDSTPVEDLRKLKYQMRRDGYPFRLSDVFVYIDNYAELEGYLTGIDLGGNKQERIYGLPGGGDTCYIPVAGCNVHGIDTGISEGGCLGIDQKNPGAEFHYYNDPAFSTATISYDTIENGTTVRKTINNFGIHFNQFEENDTHDTILQFWCENKTVVTKPYGILYDTGI